MTRIETVRNAIVEIEKALSARTLDFWYLEELQAARGREGTLISGTLCLQDLIPAYLTELERRDEAKYEEVKQPLPDSGDDPWWHSEDACEYSRQLEDALCDTDNILHFGSHPGDGSDIGFWMDEDTANVLADLEAQAGEYKSPEDAEQALEDWAMDIQFRSGWHRAGVKPDTTDIRIRLNTHPAIFIIGTCARVIIGSYEIRGFKDVYLTSDEEEILLQFISHVWRGYPL